MSSACSFVPGAGVDAKCERSRSSISSSPRLVAVHSLIFPYMSSSPCWWPCPAPLTMFVSLAACGRALLPRFPAELTSFVDPLLSALPTTSLRWCHILHQWCSLCGCRCPAVCLHGSIRIVAVPVFEIGLWVADACGNALADQCIHSTSVVPLSLSRSFFCIVSNSSAMSTCFSLSTECAPDFFAP